MHAKAAGKLFEACDRGEVEIVVLSAVLAECVFVLESFYEHRRANIAAALGTLISSPGVAISENAVPVDALEGYRRTKMHFVDCLLAAAAKAGDMPVATFDEGFRKLGDVRIDNP